MMKNELPLLFHLATEVGQGQGPVRFMLCEYGIERYGRYLTI